MDHKSVIFNLCSSKDSMSAVISIHFVDFSNTQGMSVSLSHSTLTASGAEANSCKAFCWCTLYCSNEVAVSEEMNASTVDCFSDE